MSASPGRRAFLAVFSVPLAWTLAFLVAPYAVMLAISFWTRRFPVFVPDFQFGNYVQLFTDPQYVTVLLRTLKIAAATTVASVLVAYPLAYFIVFTIRHDCLRRAIYFLVVVPLWVSYLLRAYTWKIILGTDGALNSLLLWTGVIDAPIEAFLYNQVSMVVTLTYIFIPFMVMPLFAALERIPRSLIEASEDLGVGPFETFLRVILPLSVPGVVAGATMTFCLSFGDFVAPVLVGGPTGTMVATVLQSQFGAALNWPLGSALAVVILAIVIVVLQTAKRLEAGPRVALT